MKKERTLKRTTVHLYEGQMETLQTLHPGISGADVIRKLIDGYINMIKAKTPDPKIEVDL